VAERVRKGELGKLAKVSTTGVAGGRNDPPKTANIESRLQGLVWDNDLAIGGSFIVSFDIHPIDAAIWVLGQRPVAAMGASRICRVNPHGDSHDACSVVYEYANGLIHEHSGQALPNGADGELSCRLFGQRGHAVVDYTRKARFHIRGQKEMTAEVVDLYAAGAKRNIASFYSDVTAGRLENPTVRRAMDGCLTCILGREAAFRHGRLTMDELLKENKRIEVDLSGLKV
jgi:predicted dehydrogenase